MFQPKPIEWTYLCRNILIERNTHVGNKIYSGTAIKDNCSHKGPQPIWAIKVNWYCWKRKKKKTEFPKANRLPPWISRGPGCYSAVAHKLTRDTKHCHWSQVLIFMYSLKGLMIYTSFGVRGGERKRRFFLLTA